MMPEDFRGGCESGPSGHSDNQGHKTGDGCNCSVCALVDANPPFCGDHSDYVGAIFQQEQMGSNNTGFSTLLNSGFSEISACSGSIPDNGVWPSQEGHNMFANMADAATNSAPSVPDPGQSMSPFGGTYYSPSPTFMPALPLAHHPELPREGWTQKQQDMLIKGRQDGRGYKDIAKEMLQMGFEISPNALVKRFKRIQMLHLSPLSKAINNVKPDIMTCIKTELERLGSNDLQPAHKKALDEIMEDLDKSIPNLVRNRLFPRRKAEQSLVSGQGL